MSIFESADTYERIDSTVGRMAVVQKEMDDLGTGGMPCLLIGPPGCGKEYLARRYADAYRKGPGQRATVRCRALICAGLNVRDLESILREEAAGAAKLGSVLLYLDEIASLPSETLAVIPHLNEQIWLSKRSEPLGSHVVPVCATEHPKLADEQPVLMRLGRRIQVPGLSERQEDVARFLEFFIGQSLTRLPVIHLLAHLPPGIPLTRHHTQIGKRTQMLCRPFLPLAKGKSWIGELRDLRIAVELAISRPKECVWEAFVSAAVRFFSEYVQSMTADGPRSKDEGLERTPSVDRVNEFSTELETIPSLPAVEKHRLAVFLAEKVGRPFSASQFSTALNLKPTTARNRIKTLGEAGLIRPEGQGRNTSYAVTHGKLVVPLNPGAPLQLPKVPLPGGEELRVDACKRYLGEGRCIFMQAHAHLGLAIAVASAHDLRESHTTFFFSFEGKDLATFLGKLAERLGQDLEINDHPESLRRTAQNLTPALKQRIGEDTKGLIILDHVERLKNHGTLPLLAELPAQWKNCQFVLIAEGLKMESEFEACGFLELSLR